LHPSTHIKNVEVKNSGNKGNNTTLKNHGSNNIMLISQTWQQLKFMKQIVHTSPEWFA
jgi:hypothetical protein